MIDITLNSSSIIKRFGHQDHDISDTVARRFNRIHLLASYFQLSPECYFVWTFYKGVDHCINSIFTQGTFMVIKYFHFIKFETCVHSVMEILKLYNYV